MARSCTYDPAERTYTLTLQTGVTFSDGSPLTARDVVSSLERARQSQRYAARLAEVSSVRAQGDTVVIAMNADLATLYNAAFAFLYPSLRESFGIPLVEAMACGTPVITGNTSSMPEIGGPDILAADPCRPEEIAGAVLRLENEDALYRQQREYGLLRARQFSWKKTADELIQVYQSLDI